MRTSIAVVVSAGCAVSSAFGQDLGHKAAPATGTTLVVGATIHTVSGATIENGFVLVAGERIGMVGAGVPEGIDPSVRMVDAAGLHIYPGLISPCTILGLTEIASVAATRDYVEVGHDGFSPEARATVALNPDSTLIPVARSNGVLIAGVFPGLSGFYDGGGGVIPGRAGVIRLDGWTTEDMTVEPDIGVVLKWPSVRPVVAAWQDRSIAEQKKSIAQKLDAIESFFLDAKVAAQMEREPGDDVDVRFEAMAELFAAGDAQATVYISAQEHDQIVSAVAFVERHGLKAVIVGGRDAALCADLLKAHDITVMIKGVHRMPKRADSAYDEAFTLPARLEALGVSWCLASGEEAAHERNAPYQAATAVAFGLDEDAAIRAITLDAARALGIDAEYGSIEAGKSATFIVTDGSPLEITTMIAGAFIDGRVIDMTSKHEALDEKYRERYRQMGLIEGDHDDAQPSDRDQSKDQ